MQDRARFDPFPVSLSPAVDREASNLPQIFFSAPACTQYAGVSFRTVERLDTEPKRDRKTRESGAAVFVSRIEINKNTKDDITSSEVKRTILQVKESEEIRLQYILQHLKRSNTTAEREVYASIG